MQRPFSREYYARSSNPEIGPLFANVTRMHFFLSMSESTSIQYYIPEDGDDLEHPNVIVMKKKASSISLKDIREVDAAYEFHCVDIPNSWNLLLPLQEGIQENMELKCWLWITRSLVRCDG